MFGARQIYQSKDEETLLKGERSLEEVIGGPPPLPNLPLCFTLPMLALAWAHLPGACCTPERARAPCLPSVTRAVLRQKGRGAVKRGI